MINLGTAGGRFPHANSGQLGTGHIQGRFCAEHVTNTESNHLAARIPRSRDHGLESCQAVDHGIRFVQDYLVIEPFYHCSDQIVVHQDLRGFIDFSFNPDFHLPSMAVEVTAFPFIMEQTMGCVEKDLLIDTTFHRNSVRGREI
jgi:hypothetical protein